MSIQTINLLCLRFIILINLERQNYLKYLVIFFYYFSCKYNPKTRYLAALLIQKNCYNWLFKVPNGILFRLAKTDIQDILDF